VSEKHEKVRMSCEMYEVCGLSPTLWHSHMSHGENVGQYDLYLRHSYRNQSFRRKNQIL